MNTPQTKASSRELLLAAFENITVGLPFCIFKLACGYFFLTHYPDHVIVKTSGFLILVLGFIDLFINLINLLGISLRRKPLFSECLLAIIFKSMRLPRNASTSAQIELGKSLDVLVSFSIVALMIGNGSIRLFEPKILNAWNISVILNVLGAGLARFSGSLKAVSNSK